MSRHAFVDESFRDDSYLLTAALVDPRDLRRLRVVMRKMLLPGQREVHLKKEPVTRRRTLLDAVASAGAEATVYFLGCSRRSQEKARARCLTRLVGDLVAVNAHRLVLDSRAERDLIDGRTIRAALGSKPAATELTYEHVDSATENLIWIADMIGWAYGAGAEWRRKIEGIVTVVDCSRP